MGNFGVVLCMLKVPLSNMGYQGVLIVCVRIDDRTTAHSSCDESFCVSVCFSRMLERNDIDLRP